MILIRLDFTHRSLHHHNSNITIMLKIKNDHSQENDSNMTELQENLLKNDPQHQSDNQGSGSRSSSTSSSPNSRPRRSSITSPYTIPYLESKILDDIFTHESISTEKRMGLLRKWGGMPRLLSKLKVLRKEGLVSASDMNKREELYGVNTEIVSPFDKFSQKLVHVLEEELMLKAFPCLWIFNLLIALIFGEADHFLTYIAEVLLFCVFLIVKVLIQMPLDLQLNENLWPPATNIEVTVRRAGLLTIIPNTDLLVGDILILNPGTPIFVDGIVLFIDNETLITNQTKTIMKKEKAIKITGYETANDADPFIFSGSEILSGYGEMVVCCVGVKCTLRTFAAERSVLKGKIKQVVDGEAKQLQSLKRRSVLFITWIIFFDVAVQLYKLNPIELSHFPIILTSTLHNISWTLLLLFPQHISMIYIKIQRLIQNHPQVIINSRHILGELLKLDILLIDEGAIEIQQKLITREGRFQCKIINEEILTQLDNIVDIKILTDRKKEKCLEYGFPSPYNIYSEYFTADEIYSIRYCKFICNVDSTLMLSSISKTYQYLGYKVGMVAIDVEEEELSGVKEIVIATEESSEEVKKKSWAKLGSAYCEQGIKTLYKVSASFYIMLLAFISQYLFTSIVAAYGVIFLDLSFASVLFLATLESLTHFLTFKILEFSQTDTIQTAHSFWFNLKTHSLIFTVLLIYALTKINNQKDLVLFLVCKNVIGVMCNTRMVEGNSDLLNYKPVVVVYLGIFGVLGVNLLACYYFEGDVGSAAKVIVMVGIINVAYLIEKIKDGVGKGKARRFIE